MGSTKKGLKLRRLVVSEIPNPWLSEVQKVMALQSVILSGTVTASSATPESLRIKESGRGCPHPCKKFLLGRQMQKDYELELCVKMWRFLGIRREVQEG